MKQFPDILAPRYDIKVGNESYDVKILAHPLYLGDSLDEKELVMAQNANNEERVGILNEIKKDFNDLFGPGTFESNFNYGFDWGMETNGDKISRIAVIGEDSRGSEVYAREVIFNPEIPEDYIRFNEDVYCLEVVDPDGIVKDETGEAFFGLNLKKKLG